MSAQRSSTVLLWLTIVAAPGALAIETALRVAFFPEDFELVREFLRPMLTAAAWVLAGLAGLGALAGLSLQRRLVARRIAKLPEAANTAERRFRAAIGIFLLTTAVPQIPSIFATLCFTLGASIVPVVASIALTTVGVVLQAQRVPQLAA